MNISDTVDESKETYVKNHLDLDDINENKHFKSEFSLDIQGWDA